jgi:hypothetical protein
MDHMTQPIRHTRGGGNSLLVGRHPNYSYGPQILGYLVRRWGGAESFARHGRNVGAHTLGELEKPRVGIPVGRGRSRYH